MAPGDIELDSYLTNTVGPVSLVLDLRIVHDRFGSNTDPSLNGHLHYPNDIDPPPDVAFMTVITSTSGRLHSEFVRLLFLQDHGETDRFFYSFRSSVSVNRP